MERENYLEPSVGIEEERETFGEDRAGSVSSQLGTNRKTVYGQDQVVEEML